LPKNPSGKLLKRELRQVYAGTFTTPGTPCAPVTQKAADPA
jgi:acyl-coenzyme A synthetase/AMP-(fatty) acid ligase